MQTRKYIKRFPKTPVKQKKVSMLQTSIPQPLSKLQRFTNFLKKHRGKLGLLSGIALSGAFTLQQKLTYEKTVTQQYKNQEARIEHLRQQLTDSEIAQDNLNQELRQIQKTAKMTKEIQQQTIWELQNTASTELSKKKDLINKLDDSNNQLKHYKEMYEMVDKQQAQLGKTVQQLNIDLRKQQKISKKLANKLEDYTRGNLETGIDSGYE